jgi:hypothetical protein
MDTVLFIINNYMKNYRRIWEKVNGAIPVDEQGRKYEIHHLDGNRENNSLSNLTCVSVLEHYQLHLEKGDYGAAYRIAQRMELDPQIKSELASAANTQRINKGTHPFLDPEVRKKIATNIARRVEEGTHQFQNPEVIQKAVQAKREKYTTTDLAIFAKKGWDKWKEKGFDPKQRTIQGSAAGADKIRNTKWYHKLTGEQLRTIPEDPRIADGWIKGRFNGKEISKQANLSKQNKK